MGDARRYSMRDFTAEYMQQHNSTNEQQISMKLAEGHVNSFLCALDKVILSGDSVVFKGRFTIGAKITSARMGRNPKTGEAVEIPVGKKAFLRMSKEYKLRF